MINQIIMQGLKGQMQAQPLTKKNIIIGPNGSGKTSRIQALGLSLLGYVPGQGKLAAETFKLASANPMTVGLSMDGFSFTRSFTRTEKRNTKDGTTSVAINESVTVSPGRGEKTETQKKARIMAEVGSFPVMLDFQEFLSLSDAKRRDFFYGLSPFSVNDWDRIRVSKYLREELLTSPLAENNPEQYEIMTKLIDQCLEQFPEGFDVQLGIQAMFDWAKEKQSHWLAEKKNADGAVKKLADVKNSMEATDRNIAKNKEDLANLREELIANEKLTTQSAERVKVTRQRLARMDQLRKFITEKESELKRIPVDDSEFDDTIARLQDTLVNFEAMSEELEQLNADRATTTEHLQALREQQGEVVATAQKLQGEINTLEASIKTINGTLRGDAENPTRVCVISHKIGCTKDFGPYLIHVESEAEAKRIALEDTNMDKAALDCQIASMTGELNGIAKRISEITTTIGRGTRENQAIQKRIDEINKSKGDTSVTRAKIQNEVKLYQEEITRLMAQPVESAAPTDIIDSRISGLRQQIEKLQKDIEEQEQAKIALANVRASMVDSKEAIYYFDCSKHLAEALGSKGIQGEMVKSILDPIRDAIGRNLAAIGVANQFFFRTEGDNGKEIFQFGWLDNDGRELNFDALSTGQQILLLVAMTITLLDRANPPLKVLAIDNIENLDRDNMRRVIAGLNVLSDQLDNVILVGVVSELPFGSDLDGWSIWNTGAVREEVPISA